MTKRVLSQYQFRTHPVGNNPTFADSYPNTWRTDIVEVGPVKYRDVSQGGRRIGFIEWEKTKGDEPSRINEVSVDPEHRRQGLATMAFRHSQKVSQASGGRIPTPLHSSWRTPEGDGWAKSTGDPVPPNEY